jgi:hypothetical protein
MMVRARRGQMADAVHLALVAPSLQFTLWDIGIFSIQTLISRNGMGSCVSIWHNAHAA